MQIKAETREEKIKKHSRFAFILRRQWVGKRIPTKSWPFSLSGKY